MQTRSPSTFKGFVPIYSQLFDLSNHVTWPSSMCQPESVSNIYFTSTGAVLCYMVKIICTIYRAHIYTHTYVCHCFPESVYMCITVPQSWGVETENNNFIFHRMHIPWYHNWKQTHLYKVIKKKEEIIIFKDFQK